MAKGELAKRELAYSRGCVWAAITVLCTWQVTTGAPTVLLNQYSGGNTYFEGEDAQLSCHFLVTEGGTVPTVSWRRNNNILLPNGKFSYIVGQTSRSVLTIRQITSSEAGWYGCVGQNKASQAFHDFLVLVQVPPRLSLEPAPQRVVAKTDAIMACQAEGSPKPLITWTKNGKKLTAGGKILIDNDTNWLLIRSVTAQDEANYTCTAQNIARRSASVSSTAQLSLENANTFGLSAAASQKQFLRAVVGNTVSLQVNLKLSDSLVNYTWWRNSDQIYSGSTRQTSTVTYNLKVGQDSSGVYSFSADGESMVVASLLVVEPAKITTPSSQVFGVRGTYRNVSLRCTATGSPPPDVQWENGKVGNIVRSSPQDVYLILRSLVHAPVRRFTCRAENNMAAPGESPKTVVVTSSSFVNVVETCELTNGKTSNHILNPDAAAGTSRWNITSFSHSGPGARTETNPQTGNAYFLIETSPNSQGGEITQKAPIDIGVANISMSFQMKVDKLGQNQTGKAIVVIEGVERPPAETVIKNLTFSSTSSLWSWTNYNLTLDRTSPIRGVRVTMRSELTPGATTGAKAFFDDFCIRLFIFKNVGPVLVKSLPARTDVYFGYSHTLDCTAEGRPPPKYQWFRNNQIIAGEKGATYTVRATSKITIPGTYKCRVVVTDEKALYNQELSSSTQVAVIDVVAPKINTTIRRNYEYIKGERATFACAIVGAPITYTWKHNNAPVDTKLPKYEQSGQKLIIKNATRTDAGLYDCRGNNTNGYLVSRITLEIFTKPELVSGGSIYNPYRQKREEVATFVCPIDGDPPPEITWLVNGNDVLKLGSVDADPNATAKSLNFKFVKSFPDPSNITCYGTNRFGKSPEIIFHTGTNVVVPTPSGLTPMASTASKDWWEKDLWLNLALWIWIAIGVAALALVIILIICCCHCRRQRKRTLTPNRMLNYSSGRSDTVRHQYVSSKSDDKLDHRSFIAMNPVVDTEQASLVNNRYSTSSPASPTSDIAPPLPSMTSHPALRKAEAEEPPPLPSMTSHPALVKKMASDEDYIQPEEGLDEMASRPPAPIPTSVPNAPTGSPLAPLIRQEYMNVDNRPPEPPPGIDYENMAG